MTTEEYAEGKSKYPKQIILWDRGLFIEVGGIDSLIINELLKYPLAKDHPEWHNAITHFIRFGKNKLNECINELRNRHINFVVINSSIKEVFADNQFLMWKKHIEDSFNTTIRIGSIVTYKIEDDDNPITSEIISSEPPINKLGIEFAMKTKVTTDGSYVSSQTVLGRELLNKCAGETFVYKANNNLKTHGYVLDVSNNKA